VSSPVQEGREGRGGKERKRPVMRSVANMTSFYEEELGEDYEAMSETHKSI